MFKTGPANKRKGIKKSPAPAAPHPGKTDGSFGNKTNYADFAKTNIKTNGKSSKVGGKLK